MGAVAAGSAIGSARRSGMQHPSRHGQNLALTVLYLSWAVLYLALTVLYLALTVV
jgi:hypothetical protein